MTRCFLVLLVTLVLAASLAAADLSGIWSLELDPDFSGNQDTVGCGFTQDGNKLLIKCGGADIAGEVNNRQVTWQFMTGPDKATKATFSGVLDDQAKTISGTWHLASDPPKDGKFTATKEK
jgi:hypothetical protein